MFGQKARQSKPVQSNDFSNHRSPKLFCYLDKSKITSYFVYWKAEACTLGATDLGENLFEAILDRKERKKLLKNVAESLVEAKWKSTFTTKGLKLGSISDEAMEIRYISECVQLPRIEDSELRKKRNVELLKNALDEISELSDLLKTNSSLVSSSNAGKTTCSSQQAGKRRHETSPPAPSANKELSFAEKNRRKRGKATGLVFQDDDEEEE